MKKLLLICAATLLFAPAVHAQCAGCGADFNKAEREKMDREAKAEKAAAEEKQLRESLGNGTAGAAADDKIKHREELDKAGENAGEPK